MTYTITTDLNCGKKTAKLLLGRQDYCFLPRPNTKNNNTNDNKNSYFTAELHSSSASMELPKTTRAENLQEFKN